MATKVGPARAAGRPAPPGTGRVILGERTVRIETRRGTVRAKKGEGPPSVDLELGAEERLVDFVISVDDWLPFTATLAERVAAEKRKTVDWEWEATVEVPVPPSRKRAPRRKKGS